MIAPPRSLPQAALLAALSVLLPGCLFTDRLLLAYIDSDSDGFFEEGFPGSRTWDPGTDCDDNDPAINQGQPELCSDGVDNDCDHQIDEDGFGEIRVYADVDKDSYGDPNAFRNACTPDADWIERADDCDDRNDRINPEVPETCDGIDNDCDGTIDDGAPETPWHRDDDGDGFGTAADVVLSCAPPAGHVPNATDCNDHDDAIFPGATDTPYDGVDADCARDDDYDVDGDSFLHPASGSAVPDCDDADASVFPTAPERWYDGLDQDCDPTTEWDQDGDGFPLDADCDDNNPLRRPGAPETWYDGIDQDCDPATEWDQDGDGLTPPGAPVGSANDCDDQASAVRAPTTWYDDRDDDGWGDRAAYTIDCYPPPHTSAQPGDCNDYEPTVNPGAPEVCSAWDDDCDGLRDEDTGPFWYPDADRDGHGDATYEGYRACSGPPQWLRDNTDCNDLIAAIRPGAEEICDDLDNDCDDEVDFRADVDLREDHWRDADHDGWGTGRRTAACDLPDDDLAPQSGDCDDARPDIRPGAAEVCDGVDNNCAEGTADEDRVLYWPDDDRDGWGDRTYTADLLCNGARSGDPAWVLLGGDCNDDNPLIQPLAPEVCDGVDNDCDETTDSREGLDLRVDHWPDADGDGWGAGSGQQPACDLPDDGLVRNQEDCDDTRDSVHPAAVEVCDGVDNNCTSGIDDEDRIPWWPDLDGDTWGDRNFAPELICRGVRDTDPFWASRGGDCDDDAQAVSPSATEICDGLDNDCDDTIDRDRNDADLREPHWSDADGDGYGAAYAGMQCNVANDAYATQDGDCDDADSTRFPNNPEVCDNRDNNCLVGVLDEAQLLYWRDEDRDGFGDIASERRACAAPGPLWIRRGGDCDDADPVINPRTEEVCDEIDNDCDGTVDLLAGQPLRETLWVDDDGDGHGAVGSLPEITCYGPGLARTNDDCDDTNAARYPGAAEVCDTVDNNCADGIRDEGQSPFWRDRDGDGWGDDATLTYSCSRPAGTWTGQGGDCDDSRYQDHPQARERCDYRDNDCEGSIDFDNLGRRLQKEHFEDLDGDGYGGASVGDRCETDTDMFVAEEGDCDDAVATIHPFALDESCDLIDQDCSGLPDNGLCVYGYPDLDGDRHGDEAAQQIYELRTTLCSAVPAGQPCTAEVGDDCEDGDASVHPGAEEICDGKENRCLAGADIDRFGNQDSNDDFNMVTGEKMSDVCNAYWLEAGGDIYLRGKETLDRNEIFSFCHSRGYKVWWADDETIPFTSGIFTRFASESSAFAQNYSFLESDDRGNRNDLPVPYHTAIVKPCPINGYSSDEYYYYDGRTGFGHAPSCTLISETLASILNLSGIGGFVIYINTNPYSTTFSYDVTPESHPICELDHEN